jgi:hypothetical protein
MAERSRTDWVESFDATLKGVKEEPTKTPTPQPGPEHSTLRAKEADAEIAKTRVTTPKQVASAAKRLDAGSAPRAATPTPQRPPNMKPEKPKTTARPSEGKSPGPLRSDPPKTTSQPAKAEAAKPVGKKTLWQRLTSVPSKGGPENYYDIMKGQ